MASAQSEGISNETPQETWDGLKLIDASILVDVRTTAEWAFVGIPDISTLGKRVLTMEWKMFPDMATNLSFAADLMEQLGGTAPSKIYFLCRSGVRSVAAAHEMKRACIAMGLDTECVNVLEGFEGDLDSFRHRGLINGWKSRGLAWGQS
ncbi:MAG: sulfurtransferase [Rhodobacteraceae bacterium]|nr:MAG: sulfurtransferase [Paracoccaceae bacterium]